MSSRPVSSEEVWRSALGRRSEPKVCGSARGSGASIAHALAKLLEPVGDYDTYQFGWFANTSRSRRDDELSLSVRINFIHRPGSDLFIVFNEERGSASSIWDVNTRAAVVKLTYLARL